MRPFVKLSHYSHVHIHECEFWGAELEVLPLSDMVFYQQSLRLIRVRRPSPSSQKFPTILVEKGRELVEVGTKLHEFDWSPLEPLIIKSPEMGSWTR